MKQNKINFNKIIPSEYNPRKMKQDEMRVLSQNLEEFGLVDPIIINLKNNHIVGGHQRYEALKKKYKKNKELENKQLHLIELGDVGWVFETDDLTIEDDVHEKSLNISLNKISGEWDYDKLSIILSDLKKLDFNMDLTGFDPVEIEQYVIPPNLSSEFKEIEDIKEGKKEVRDDGMAYPVEQKFDGETNDEVAVSSEEIEKIKKYKCPQCGYEW